MANRWPRRANGNFRGAKEEKVEAEHDTKFSVFKVDFVQTGRSFFVSLFLALQQLIDRFRRFVTSFQFAPYRSRIPARRRTPRRHLRRGIRPRTKRGRPQPVTRPHLPQLLLQNRHVWGARVRERWSEACGRLSTSESGPEEVLTFDAALLLETLFHFFARTASNCTFLLPL